MNLPRIIVDVVLFCPHCGVRHVDTSRNGEKWHRRAHTTHRCQACGGDFDVYASGQEIAVTDLAASRSPSRGTRSALRAPCRAWRSVGEVSWFVDAVHSLQMVCAENVLRDLRMSITVSSEFGLSIGMRPGSLVRIHGPAGFITIKSENSHELQEHAVAGRGDQEGDEVGPQVADAQGGRGVE